MALPQTEFSRDIILNEDKFQSTSTQLIALAERINTLETNISNSLSALEAGFDTPAGRKFFKVCGTKLLDPMRDQAKVINHVAQNLQNANNSYQSVFEDFRSLNSLIANKKNN